MVSAVIFLPSTAAYCNAMHYAPRTSTGFPPGWNGLGQTPFRGWRSWYAFYAQMNQSMIEDQIDALTTKNRTVKGWPGKVSLCDLGYCAAGIDEGWEGCGLGVNGTQHFLNGTPATNSKLFPDMKGLVRSGHAKGLKMGWYLNGCGCVETKEPASGWDVNYEGDIRSLHANGFDSVKFDGCGMMCNLTRYAELMNATGAAYEIENCHWGDCTDNDASSCPTADWCPFNFFRTSGDSNNKLGTWFDNMQTTIRFQGWDSPVSRPGCWAYPDMLQVGRLGCSSRTHGCPVPAGLESWTRTHFAAFAIISSPLVLSIALTDENLEPLLDIIGNKQAIAINEAWAGHPGTLVRTLGPPGDTISSSGQLPPEVSCRVGEMAGGDIHRANLTVAESVTWCESQAKCAGFHAEAPYPSTCKSLNGAHVYDIHFKDPWGAKRPNTDAKWTNWLVGGERPIAGTQLWAKPLGVAKVAALFINGGRMGIGTNVSLEELNITSRAMVTVTDVWTGEDAGPVIDGRWHTGVVASLDSRFVVFEAAR